MIFNLKKIFSTFLLIKLLSICEITCQVRLKEDTISRILYQSKNVSINNDEIEDISAATNIKNDIITFEPDIFNNPINISKDIMKEKMIIMSRVNSFQQNKISFKCLSTEMFTCVGEDNKNNDGFIFKIITNKDGKEYGNRTYLNVEIFIHDINGISKEYNKGKNIITFIRNNTSLVDDEKSKVINSKEKETTNDGITFDQPTYNVMLFSGPTKPTIILRGKVHLLKDKKSIPKIWIDHQNDSKNIFEVNNFKLEKDGVCTFDVTLKGNMTIEDSNENNKVISGTIKAKQSDIIGLAEINAEIIPKQTTYKETTKSSLHEISILENNGNDHEINGNLEEITSQEHIEDLIVPFRNFNEDSVEVSRIDVGSRYENIDHNKDNGEVIQYAYNNISSIKSQDNTLNSKPFVLNNKLRSNVYSERNNYKEKYVNEDKMYILENINTKMNGFIIQNNSSIPLTLPIKGEWKKNNISMDKINLLENSKNGTIISRLTMLDNINDDDISIIMFNETKDYLFKIEDNNLILICQNKQQKCIDYEEENEIELLLLTNYNNPILLNILVSNEDETDPKLVLFNKDIKISNDKMLNQFLFSVKDDDGIESNEILLEGDVSKYFTIQKAQDDGLYQIVYISTPPPGKSELSIIVKGKNPSKRSIIKNVAVKVIDNIHKAHFRKDIYNIKMPGNKIIKDEKLVHLELEGVSIDSVDFCILDGNPGWITIEKYGGEIKVNSVIDNLYNGKYDILIGAIDKESNKVVAKTTLTIEIVDWLDYKPVFTKKFYSISIERHQINDTIDVTLLPHNSNTKMYVKEDTIMGWNNEYKAINVSKNYISIYGNKVKIPLINIPSVKSLFFEVHLHDVPNEKTLVGIHISKNESEYQKELEEHSKLVFSKTYTSEILTFNVEIPENTPIGKVIENIYPFNPITGKNADECFIRDGFDKYFYVDVSNGDILLIDHIDFDTIKNSEFDVVISCSQNKSEPIEAIMNVKIRNVSDNPPIINILHKNYPYVYELDKNIPENYAIFNFSINDIDGETDHFIEILGDDVQKFVIDKNFDKTYSLKTASNAIFDYDDSKALKLVLSATDKGKNTGKVLITIKFTNNDSQLPYIEKKHFEFKAVENWPENVFVGTVYINGKSSNINDTEIVFSIEDQPNDYFKIEKNTGKIITGKSLKNISLDAPYEMRIVVSSILHKNFKDSAIVSINIINPDTIIMPNEKHLKIVQPKDGEIIKVSEEIDVGKKIYSVELDYSGDTLDLSKTNIEYKIINLNNNSDTTFVINDNGVIFINSQLNYEKISKYSLMIIVRNNEGIDEMESVVIFIELENENNKSPYFIEDYTNRYFIFNKSSIVLAQVKAIDNDFPPYNKIYYHIIKHCGKNYNKLQIDKTTGEIRRGKYKNIKQFKKFPTYFEVCIYASPYNFTLKKSKIIFDKNRKDQVKIKIKYIVDKEEKENERMVTNNYLHNNTIEYITSNLNEIPIYYGEDKLNYKYHKHQLFKMETFSLTPASYEPNAKILHINKNKRIFRINELSGDIIFDPKITTYPEGIYNITFTLSNNVNLNNTIVYNKEYHFVDQKNKMKFIFDTPPSKMGFRLKDFHTSIQNIFDELSRNNKYSTKIYLENEIRIEKNYKSSVCFHITDEDIVKNPYEYKNFFETLISKYPYLGVVYEEYSVRNIIKCTENWEPYLKKGFIEKVKAEVDKNSWKEYLLLTTILSIISILFALFLYYCIALKYRFHLLIKKEHLRLVTNKRIMAISKGNEKQFVKSSPQFAIGMSSDLLEY
uniref:EGF-like domain-containing protein n=1 Tax=Strongyloides venezuelensis TaxID=75913 RepID=A0A0K0F2Q2_STRVS